MPSALLRVCVSTSACEEVGLGPAWPGRCDVIGAYGYEYEAHCLVASQGLGKSLKDTRRDLKEARNSLIISK